MPTDSYARAARAKHRNPQHRADAQTLARIVWDSDTRGVRRDWLTETLYSRGWDAERFKRALFTAYALGWVTLLGWTYVCVPPPPLAALRAQRCERRPPGRGAAGVPSSQPGMLDTMGSDTPTTGTASTAGHHPGNQNHNTK